MLLPAKLSTLSVLFLSNAPASSCASAATSPRQDRLRLVSVVLSANQLAHSNGTRHVIQLGELRVVGCETLQQLQCGNVSNPLHPEKQRWKS
jgi:hypothetical protein